MKYFNTAKSRISAALSTDIDIRNLRHALAVRIHPLNDGLCRILDDAIYGWDDNLRRRSSKNRSRINAQK